MNKRFKLLAISLIVIAASAAFTLKVSKRPPEDKTSSVSTYDAAVREAEALFKRRSAEGMDISTGPCLTNDLMQGWVVDVVHSPRQKVDDQPENQCAAFIEGRATHFVELDTEGNLVRVR